MHNRKPSIAALVTLTLLVPLAAGWTRSDGASASDAYVSSQIDQRLQDSEQLAPISEAGEISPALMPRLSRAEKRALAKVPYEMDFRDVAYIEAKAAGIKRPILFVRQIAAESGFQVCARSPAGALGIAQIMPATARSWKVDPHLPEQALRVAAKQMARYEKQYGSYRLALAAYNAGPGAVSQYGGVPPYAETRNYIAKIMDMSYPLIGMNQRFELPNGLSRRFKPRLEALRRDVRRNGGRITITEGWRSYPEQVRIWKLTKKRVGGFQNAKRWAAPPGCSNHGRGYAADLGGDLQLAHRLAAKHGLVFPMSHEPWHVELAGIPSQSGNVKSVRIGGQ